MACQYELGMYSDFQSGLLYFQIETGTGQLEKPGLGMQHSPNSPVYSIFTGTWLPEDILDYKLIPSYKSRSSSVSKLIYKSVPVDG